MNKKILKILICYIMILLLFSNSTLIKSIANDETTIVVRNFNQFNAALENANDGDIIELDGSAIILDYDTNAIIGYSDKTITIKKKSGSAHILLTGTKNVKFQNIIFDGGNTLSYEPFIKTYGEYYPLASANFENVVFQNINGNINGIVYLDVGLTIFNNCTFKNNKGEYGGHVEIRGNAIVNFYKCSFTEGEAYCGGAIALMSSNSSCNIISSTITNNVANNEGGGIYNLGELTIENTKIYNNIASNGGSDIYNTGTLNMKDSIEDLQKLFYDNKLKPIAWVSDYNDNNSYLKLEFEKVEEENNQDNNATDETEKNQNEGNTPNAETTNQDDKNNENTENNQQNENNNNEPNLQNPSDEEKENNKSEQNQENISTSTSNENINNETVTNTSHNSVNDNTSSSNSNIEESSFIQKIIDKITETFNIQNPTTQQITDDSSKSITNSNESPVNQKIYITASPSNNSDYKTESSNIIPENSDSSNQTFNFSFDFKNDTYRNNDLLIILIFIQTILIVTILIILILKNKQNNKYHHYKSKKHVRKH